MPHSTPIKLAKCKKTSRQREEEKTNPETESLNNHKRGDELIDGCLLSP